MILRTIFVICSVFLLEVLANVIELDNAINATVWRSFDWQVTVQRHQQDAITVKGLIGRQLAKRKGVNIPGANCSGVTRWSGGNLPGFMMRCNCSMISSTFDPELKSCAPNADVKQGCQFTAGSWRWSTGWKWDRVDDALMIMDNKRGITTAFNATSSEYQQCSVVSLSYLDSGVKWIDASGSFLNGTKPVMFTLNNMWLLSWNLRKMNHEVKKSLKGKILKFQIECEKPGPADNEDEELEITSCLVVKVAGEVKFTSKDWEAKQNITVNVETIKNQASVLIFVFVSLVLILLIVGVLTTVCHTRGAACFANRGNLRFVSKLDDDVVETKLVTNTPDESVV